MLSQLFNIKTLNIWGNKTHPCLTPVRTRNQSHWWPHLLAWCSTSAQIHFTQASNFPLIWNNCPVLSTKSLFLLREKPSLDVQELQKSFQSWHGFRSIKVFSTIMRNAKIWLNQLFPLEWKHYARPAYLLMACDVYS